MREARRTGWVVLAAACAVMLARALLARVPPPPHHLSPEERAEVAATAARLEPKWRLDSIRLFPADHWSQDDDFFNSERRWVQGEARRRGVPESEIFDAVDRDLRSTPYAPGRKATVAPCKPRPFYD